MSSERLEQFVQRVQQVKPGRKLIMGGVALIILTVSMVVGGTALVVLRNLLGLVLLFIGLVLALLIADGPAVGWRAGPRASRAMRRAEIEEKEKERKRRSGEED